MAVIAKSFMTNESLQMREESLGETPVLLYGTILAGRNGSHDASRFESYFHTTSFAGRLFS